MARIVIKRGDLKPDVSAYLTDSSGKAVDLTTADSVRFIMKSNVATTPKINALGGIVSAAEGKVVYNWSGTDTDTVGIYNAEFEVYWGSGVGYQTFPSESYIEVEIVQDLGGSA